MGFFNRKQEDNSIIEVEAVPAELAETSELERMVYETYQKRLRLEDELSMAKATIERLTKQTDQLRAAETFSRQSEDENKRLSSKVEELQRNNDYLKEQLNHKKAHIATLEVKIEKLSAEDEGRAKSCNNELVDRMLDALIYENGGWSKQRVKEFVGGFAVETDGDDPCCA